jgi:imidazolonepropionase-like amidohydrolase
MCGGDLLQRVPDAPGGRRARPFGGDLGTVTRGTLADMVLLQADPLANIRNTQKVELVIQGGRVWTTKELIAVAHR